MHDRLSGEVLEQLRDILVSLTGSWSANKMTAMIHAADIGMRRQDILAIIRGHLGSGNRRPGPKSQMALLGLPGTELGTDYGTELGTELPGQKHRENGAEKSVPGIGFPPTPPKFNIASELRSSGLLGHFVPSQSKNAPAREDKNNDDGAKKWAAWIADLGTEFRAIAKLQLCDLKTEQRYTLGRTHAVLFGNYRVDEKANRAAGFRFSTQFARMGNSKRFGDLTARQYIVYGLKVLQMRAGKPFHSPFDIDAVVDYE